METGTRKFKSSRLKSYAWRATAVYVCAKILAAFLGFYSSIANAEDSLVQRAVSILSSLGFAPASGKLLLTLIKIGWVLLITEFKIAEIVGLIFYVATIIVWLPAWLIFRRITSWDELTPPTEATVTKPQLSRFLVAAVLSLFVAWFLLYGSATTQGPLIIGTFLSGFFFVFLLYRLLLRSNPTTERRFPMYGALGELNLSVAKSIRDRTKKDNTTKTQVQLDQKINGFFRRWFIRLTLLMRGRRAKRRIAIYILLEYIAALVVVAAGAVLFWAILTKTFLFPQLPLSTALLISASHFLPGVQRPAVAAPLPLWASLGPAATAWILFVLYIGPAGSLLPEKQRLAGEGIVRIYNLYRTTVITLGKEKRYLSRTRSKLEIDAPKPVG